MGLWRTKLVLRVLLRSEPDLINKALCAIMTFEPNLQPFKQYYLYKCTWWLIGSVWSRWTKSWGETVPGQRIHPVHSVETQHTQTLESDWSAVMSMWPRETLDSPHDWSTCPEPRQSCEPVHRPTARSAMTRTIKSLEQQLWIMFHVVSFSVSPHFQWWPSNLVRDWPRSLWLQPRWTERRTDGRPT